MGRRELLLEAERREQEATALETRATELRRDAERLREIAGRDPVADGPTRSRHDPVHGEELTPAHRAAITASRYSEGDPFGEALARAGLSLRGLAKEVGCSSALLSQARRGNASISREIAERVERRCGFAANKTNWPKIRT